MTYFLGMSTHSMTTEMWTVLREARVRTIYLDSYGKHYDGKEKRETDEHRSLLIAARDLADAGLVEVESHNYPAIYITDDGKRFYTELAPEYDEKFS